MAGLLIGEVAERTGLTAPTIRYYESIGLVKPPARSESGYRRYSESTVQELTFIKKAQALGFSLDEIAEILTLSRAGQRPCSHVLDLARRHLAAVDERIQQLRRFRTQLAREIGKWDGRREPSCDGLCEIIDTAEERALSPVEIRLHTREMPRARSQAEVAHGRRRAR
jgi:MerR family transcriptional regulator, copper efflux regulator